MRIEYMIQAGPESDLDIGLSNVTDREYDDLQGWAAGKREVIVLPITPDPFNAARAVKHALEGYGVKDRAVMDSLSVKTGDIVWYHSRLRSYRARVDRVLDNGTLNLSLDTGGKYVEYTLSAFAQTKATPTSAYGWSHSPRGVF
jgi:hypothetical protein